MVSWHSTWLGWRVQVGGRLEGTGWRVGWRVGLEGRLEGRLECRLEGEVDAVRCLGISPGVL